MELWVDRHRPRRISEVAGQGKAMKELLEFLGSWRPGRAAFLVGPPGVGKTAAVEAVASERGLFLLRMNASDSRTAKEVFAGYQGGQTHRLLVVDLFE